MPISASVSSLISRLPAGWNYNTQVFNTANYGYCNSAVRVCIQLFKITHICHPDSVRGPLPTAPLNCGYGRHIHEAYNDALMIITVSFPPGIITSVDQVPLYTD